MSGRIDALRDAMSSARMRSRTHWYIDHDAGLLHITVARTMLVETDVYIDGVTTYQRWTGASYTTLSIADAAAFATAMATTHIAMTYAKPLTVTWILPDGTTVSGGVINRTVPSGTTLAICDDWRYTSINMHDTAIVTTDWGLLPPILGVLKGHNMHGRICDLPNFAPVYYPSRRWLRGGIRICGTAATPSHTVGTLAEIQSKMTVFFCGRREIAYAPHVTGSLEALTAWNMQPVWNIFSAEHTRLYQPTFAPDANGDPVGAVARTATLSNTYQSYHHCGIHGYPYAGVANPLSVITDLEYYACPNATPSDYDNTISVIMDNWMWGDYVASWVGDVWSGVSSSVTIATQAVSGFLLGYSHTAGARIIPAYGTLKISNRTADPTERARRVGILRAAGWTVTEVDDSLETGIYAAAD